MSSSVVCASAASRWVRSRKSEMCRQASVMGPVFPLIFACARANPEAGEIRRLAGQVQDWNEVVRTATRLGVAPLLSWSLSRACPDGVPAPILAVLRDRFRESTKQNLVLTSELLRLLALFRQAGISAVPYKGPALAAQLYDPPGLRPSGDLDVLVDRADVPRAIDLVTANGYRPVFPNANLRTFDAGGRSLWPAFARLSCTGFLPRGSSARSARRVFRGA